MTKIDIAGISVDNVTNAQTLQTLHSFLQDGQKHYLVTLYSEQVVFAFADNKYQDVLNKADLVLPDGIGILWAAKFLSLPSSNWFQTLWQFKKTLWSIILFPKYIKTVIKEQVTGRILVYDLVQLAQENNYSISLVGGEGNVAAQSAYELKKTYPNLRINLALSGRAFDEGIIKEIAHSNSDILLIAYSPPRQEKWIADNLPNLNVKLAVGLGGTFDYLAGKRPVSPNFMHYMGLEWLWRLITQPWRIVRIWNAVPVFMFKILNYKLHAKRS